ncbi:hypothetical protein CRI77_02785 [Mycolicibacterium duvalii]|uniref:Uncharacterized protein n=1 Tax=Mycolicibacterium duvalii TaxID=39688 RepID=A0A7I7JZR0_9MYCO|nr:hypothetical protein CRI77_02785 [Mycolicibacterium duvalii]BBX16759.1 hypothetical protein MDUV_16190 [Mycolicibacterium duvalii]
MALALLGILLLLGGLVTVVVWPETDPPAVSAEPRFQTSSLRDKPPTVILNAIDVRSLYPLGYIDYDSSQAVREELDIDFDADYQTTSEPDGCERDPLTEARYFSDFTNPERYRRYPLTLLMFPVDDPGGNEEDSRAFGVSIFPSPTEGTSLDEVRAWYRRCAGAVVTTTVVKNGQVLRQSSHTNDAVVVDAPKYDADDTFSLATEDEDTCDFVGLVRGIIIDMYCPPAQKDAGAELFRTLIARIRQA